MNHDPFCDETLLGRLPLPLAQLYRRAHDSKRPLKRHLNAFYLWEAALKLLAAVAVVEYGEHPDPDPQLAELLTKLTRPSLGHWWEFVRRLVPVLANRGDAGFQKIRDLLLGRNRDDLPQGAWLDALLRDALEGKRGVLSTDTDSGSELFDRLVQYGNEVEAHAAPGQLKDDFNERMAGALLAGLGELLARLDVLAGRRIQYILPHPYSETACGFSSVA